MLPKFARSQDLEHVSRAQLKHDADDLADAENAASDFEIATSKRKLHELLLSEFGECLSITSGHAHWQNKTTRADVQDGLTSFRLLSSTAPPRIISISPKPPLPPKTRSPDCEDNPLQADERMRRAQSVAVDFAWLESQSQKHFKPSVQDDRKLVRMRGDMPDPHPAVMVTECHRWQTARGQTLGLPLAGASDSPHSLRATCVVLPINFPQDSQSHHKERTKAKRRRLYERPSPAYWRSDSNQLGKCMGYAQGYPGSWSVRYGDPKNRWYVRDTMRKATFGRSTGVDV